MKKKTRKRQTPRPRQSTFDRSLEYANNRLEKALARSAVIEAELASLRQEIPYLQSVIRALTPREIASSAVMAGIQILSKDGTSKPFRMTPIQKIIADSLPANIKPFVEPITSNVDELPDENDFLNVKIPGEQELLP